MKFLDRIFGRPTAANTSTSDDIIVVVPIPPLVTLFMALEKQKGEPLTEAEVTNARDKAACITMTVSHRDQLAESRGFADINPEMAWPEWQAIREILIRDGEL